MSKIWCSTVSRSRLDRIICVACCRTATSRMLVCTCFTDYRLRCPYYRTGSRPCQLEKAIFPLPPEIRSGRAQRPRLSSAILENDGDGKGFRSDREGHEHHLQGDVSADDRRELSRWSRSA